MAEGLPHDSFDRSLKLLWLHEPEVLLSLIDPTGHLRFVQALPTEKLVLQRADAVAWVEDGPVSYPLHVEFEAEPGLDMPHRVLVYNVLIQASLSQRPPVRSVLFLLSAPPADFSAALSYAWSGASPCLTFRFETIRVYEIPSMELAKTPALAQVAPLGAGFSLHSEVVARRAVASIRRGGKKHWANRLGLLSILLRAKGVPKGLVDAIIHSEEVRMSYAYQEILQEGIQQGIQQGRLKTLHNLIAYKYDTIPGIEMLLARCTEADLDWLEKEILRVAKGATLRDHLEKRLNERR